MPREELFITTKVWITNAGYLKERVADYETQTELAASTVENWEEYDTVFIGYAGGIIGLNQEKPTNQGFALV